MQSIIDSAHNALTGDTLRRLSSQIEETPTATERGLEYAMPISIAGLAMAASSERSAGELLTALRGGDYPHVGAEELSPTVSDPGATDRLAQSGQGLLGRIFGTKLDGIVDALAGQTGVRKTSATKLLGLSAPIVLDLVGKRAQSERLDANGLSRFLDDQSRVASGSLPGPVSSALAAARHGFAGHSAEEMRPEWRPGEHRGMADQIRQRAGGAVGTARERVEGAVADVRERALRDRARHVSAAEVAPHTQRSSRGLMWLLAAIALIGVLALLVARARRNDAAAPLPEGKVEGLEAPRTPPVIPEPPKVVSPGVAPEAKQSAPARPEPQTAPPEGVLGEEQDQPSTPPPEADEIDVLTVSSGAGPLMIFLKSNEPPPRHFDLQLVEFESGSSDVDGNEGLDTIADVLREHSGAKIRLVGYADPVGSTESNLKLSRERARQVKKYLVDRGVASERVETDGLGESRPKPDPEARAENRRVELIVTSR